MDNTIFNEIEDLLDVAIIYGDYSIEKSISEKGYEVYLIKNNKDEYKNILIDDLTEGQITKLDTLLENYNGTINKNTDILDILQDLRDYVND